MTGRKSKECPVGARGSTLKEIIISSQFVNSAACDPSAGYRMGSSFQARSNPNCSLHICLRRTFSAKIHSQILYMAFSADSDNVQLKATNLRLMKSISLHSC